MTRTGVGMAYGMHIVNPQMTRQPFRAKASYSANQMFYVKKNDNYCIYNVLGPDVVKMAQTEAGLEAAYKLVCNNKGDMPSTDDIIQVIEEADMNFLWELRQDTEKVQNEDIKHSKV